MATVGFKGLMPVVRVVLLL